jgi:BirA family biotin operon repressor/biotin-[acetyl-CoA-carboxylase] ligase
MTERPEVPPGCHLIAHDAVGSTNEEARKLAAAGGADRTVVWAREQTAGRGRHGRSWASPPGNLYQSILFRPDRPVAEVPQIGFSVGAAMASAIRDVTGLGVALKWPNDLYLAGKKLSGILLESAGDAGRNAEWVIAGIGVNVDVRPDLPDAGSLRDAGGKTTPSALLEAFLPRLFDLHDTWLAEGFEPVRRAWSEHALDIGTLLSVKLPGSTAEGGFGGIDAAGNLLLETATGTERVAVGDVFPLSNAATGA